MKVRPANFSWVLLPLLGVTSAFLCAAPLINNSRDPSLLGGAVYGLFLAIYFVVRRGARSFRKLGLLVLISTITSWIAFWSPIFLLALGRFGPKQGGIPLSGIIEGGVLGGFLLVVSVLVIFGPRLLNWPVILAKGLAAAVFSGLIGAIGWSLGPSLGKSLWALFPTEPLPRPESFAQDALFFVWQPLMALFIGLVTSGGALNGDSESETESRTRIF